MVPLLLATMVTAMLVPIVDALDRRGAAERPRRWLGVHARAAVVVVGGILTFVVSQFIQGAPALIDQVTQSIDQCARSGWTPACCRASATTRSTSATDTAIEALKNNQSKLTSGALSTAGTITEIVTGALLMLFTLIFLLQGGRHIFAFATLVFPRTVRDRVRDASRAGFHSLIGYVRATFLVAFVDAVGIGAGLAIMGIPLALPLASLVFLGAFVPLIGAVLTGGLAVIVALIAKGWVYALITFGLIIAVQQLEAHVLQPLVMGRAVSLHPLAVVLAITAGGVTAGIVGALLAVPIVAVLNSAARVLLAEDPEAEEAALAAGDGPQIAGATDEVEA